jgi:ferredoxin
MSLARPTLVIEASCTACGLCVVTCPQSALLPARGRPVVDPTRCTGCLECIEVCPRDAIVETDR